MDAKLCGVCGDKALGYNFNAVTCESCKAFFRRNALIQKEFRCPFNGHCEITTITRRFCQRCRLDKCTAIGMCKDLIMSEQDKVLKRLKIEENRAKKKRPSSGCRAAGGGGFKSSFKKVKKHYCKVEETLSSSSVNNNDSSSQQSAFISENSSSTIGLLYCAADDSKSAVNTTEEDSSMSLNHVSGVSVISYNNCDNIKTYNNDETVINDRLVTSSDDISMLRTMLNNTDSGGDGDVGFGHKTDNVTRDETKNTSSSLIITATNETNNNNCSNNNNNSSNSIVDKMKIGAVSSAASSEDVTKDVVQDVQRVPIEPNSIESILCEAIKLEFEAYSSIPQCRSNSRELNDAERAKLNELIVANKALLSPLDDELNSFVGDECKFRGNPQQALEADPALVDVINLTAIVIRRLIKMAKKINAFKNMCQEDQVALLKGGCTEIMILRSAMNYDPTKQTWKIPRSQDEFNLNVDILKLAKGNIYQEHERFIKTFDPKWRSDENIVLILCAITLFTPDRHRVVHQDVIKLEQNSYYYLLRRYLESIYAGCEAKSTFLKLIQKIAELHRLNEELINVYLDVNPSQVEPLLIEIFDLKH